MKRIVLWVLSTLSTLVVLFGYHTSTSATMATSGTTISGTLPGQAAAGGPSTGTSSGSAPPSAVTGTAAQTRYGPVQVQLEVTGSEITNVSILQYPDRDGRDIQINQYALPQLIQQTLDSQDSSVSMVSGATYTSQGYAQSLQSAIDQAGL